MSDVRRVAFLQPKIPDGNYLPSLGVMYLAGVLLRDGYDVRVFDENLDSDVVSGIAAFEPAILGITCVTPAVGPASRLARCLKQGLPNMRVVVGGPHVTVVPRETLRSNPVFDYGFVGECERTFPEFCRLLFEEPENREALANLPGLVYRDGDEVAANRAAPYLSDAELDTLPLPPWHLLPMERIFRQASHGLFSKGRRIMPVMTTRGCPNYCAFCSRVMGHKFRKRSVESVLGEIRWLYDTYKVDEIYFEDDTFTQDPNRAHRLLNGIIAMNLGLHLKFANGLRADKVDRPLLEKMKAAGVYWVGLGIESGSEHTQQLMFKRLDLKLAADNVRLAKRIGLKVGSNCIIGFPGETKADIRESIEYFRKLPLDSFAVVPCVPFPGTTAWMVCDREGWLTDRARDYDNYWFELFKVNPLIETPHLSSNDMAKAIRSVYLRFYLLNVKRLALVARVMTKKMLSRMANFRWLPALRAKPASMPATSRPDYAR